MNLKPIILFLAFFILGFAKGFSQTPHRYDVYCPASSPLQFDYHKSTYNTYSLHHKTDTLVLHANATTGNANAFWVQNITGGGVNDKVVIMMAPGTAFGGYGGYSGILSGCTYVEFRDFEINGRNKGGPFTLGRVNYSVIHDGYIHNTYHNAKNGGWGEAAAMKWKIDATGTSPNAYHPFASQTDLEVYNITIDSVGVEGYYFGSTNTKRHFFNLDSTSVGTTQDATHPTEAFPAVNYNLYMHNLTIKHTGWDALQVSCTKNVLIDTVVIRGAAYYGTASQNNAIIIGGSVYNVIVRNVDIDTVTGSALQVFGRGSHLYRNWVARHSATKSGSSVIDGQNFAGFYDNGSADSLRLKIDSFYIFNGASSRSINIRHTTSGGTRAKDTTKRTYWTGSFANNSPADALPNAYCETTNNPTGCPTTPVPPDPTTILQKGYYFTKGSNTIRVLVQKQTNGQITYEVQTINPD